jgi:hypothetical protein
LRKDVRRYSLLRFVAIGQRQRPVAGRRRTMAPQCVNSVPVFPLFSIFIGIEPRESHGLIEQKLVAQNVKGFPVDRITHGADHSSWTESAAVGFFLAAIVLGEPLLFAVWPSRHSRITAIYSRIRPVLLA